MSLLPTDPYGIFFRRIGYSVGLEETAARVRELEALYLSKRDVTIGMWDHLVHSAECWGLKSGHIADVFRSLGLVWRTGSDLVILENLDAMAISSALSDDGEAAERGRSFLLLWAILANDGEVFVNLLMAGFDRESCRQRLTLLVQKKRRFLSETIPGARAAERFLRAVSIERQASNPGSAGRRGRAVYPGGGRTPIVAGEKPGFPDGVVFWGDIGRLPPEGTRPAHGVGVLAGTLGGPGRNHPQRGVVHRRLDSQRIHWGGRDLRVLADGIRNRP